MVKLNGPNHPPGQDLFFKSAKLSLPRIIHKASEGVCVSVTVFVSKLIALEKVSDALLVNTLCLVKVTMMRVFW